MTDFRPDPDQPNPAEIRTRAQFAEGLATLREQAGLTVRTVASRVGVGSATVGDWFAGRGLPSLSSRDALVRVLRTCKVADDALVGEWLRAWRRVRQAPGPRPAGPEPYRGLASFQPEDAEWFFGRDALTTRLLDRLAALDATGGAVQVIVGASGSGKSSLLRAGLIPRLRSDALPGSSRWPLILCTPGSAPVEVLAERLAELLVLPPTEVAAAIRADPARCTEYAARVADGAGHRRLLVVVDQFEEVFAPEVADERDLFVDALCALGSGAAGALVAVGLRADFYAHALRVPKLLAALQDGQLTVGPMGSDELRAAIIEPARKARLEIEDGLVELLLHDVGSGGTRGAATSGAGVLPLLSHALYATWSNAHGNRMTIASYHEVGGLDGAIAASADAVYEELVPTQRELARRLFLRLVHVTTDTADTRCRVDTGELLAEYGQRAAELEDVLDRYISRRLITADTDTVEISHEALLTAWPTLRAWLDTDRAGRVVGQRLSTSALNWRREGDDPAALYRGARLAAAQEWAADHRHELSVTTASFLAASARHARRRGRRLRLLVGSLTALAVTTCVLTGYAFQQRAVASEQRRDAVDQRNQAISRLVAGRADTLRDSDPALATQLSLVAYRIAPTVEARSSLLDAAVTPAPTRLAGFAGAVQAVAYDRRTGLLAAGGLDRTVRLWSAPEPALVPVSTGPALTGPTGAVFTVALSPDGRTLAAAGEDASIHRWDVTNPARPVPQGKPITGPESTVYSVAFSPDGRILAAGSADRTVRLWDISDPARSRPLTRLTGPGAAVHSVTFSPDGRTLAAGSADGTVRLWDVTSPHRPVPAAPTRGHSLKVYAVAFSPDGRTLASGGEDRTVRLWDVTDPRRPVPRRAPLVGPSSWVNAVAFSPDGGTLVAGASDNSLHTWDVGSGIPGPAVPHPTPVTTVAFGSDPETILTGSTDAMVRRWRLPGPTLHGATDAIFNIALDPHRSILATASRDQTVRLWRVTDPRRPVPLGTALRSPSARDPFAGTVAISPDGRLLAVGTRTGPVHLWDLTDPGRPAALGPSLTGPTALVQTLAFSPDGATLAAGGDDTRVHLWSVADPRRPRRLATIDGNSPALVLSVAFSPDRRTLAIAGTDATVTLWDVTDPARPSPLGPPLTGFAGYVYGIGFSPDGRTLAAGSADRTVRLWDLADPRRPVPLGSPIGGPTSHVYSVAFSPDGRLLAVAATDATARLWDVSERTRPVALATLTRLAAPVYAVMFGPDGRTLIGAGADSTVRLWETEPETVSGWVCGTAGAPITRAEWTLHVPGVPFAPSC
ncbi:helix-turn-helix domain-containing protein [Plantactinospora sp. S1510]|uniref:Helix-turn-helix domain-containing protein n=1 Tax=Plantactinospora alkalitolerans TaxID=2789879 RepID=A0ABS0H0I3_9ACTN|nr:helix-turn-helix domain-containing protein [Plantactinospora alkalitolerans]MBF9131968.1 helix-turn-helix domain-containing protein [Plantactinospora alkalitolerans]